MQAASVFIRMNAHACVRQQQSSVFLLFTELSMHAVADNTIA